MRMDLGLEEGKERHAKALRQTHRKRYSKHPETSASTPDTAREPHNLHQRRAISRRSDSPIVMPAICFHTCQRALSEGRGMERRGVRRQRGEQAAG